MGKETPHVHLFLLHGFILKNRLERKGFEDVAYPFIKLAHELHPANNNYKCLEQIHALEKYNVNEKELAEIEKSRQRRGSLA